MGIKYVWAGEPVVFKAKSGKDQVVGLKVIHDTGKHYPSHGKRAAEKAAKRKAKQKNGEE